MDLPRATIGVLIIVTLIALTIWVLRPFLGATIWASMIVVATGPVEELRERGRGADHVRVRIAGGNGAGWVGGVPGVEVVEDTVRGTLIRLPAGGDP